MVTEGKLSEMSELKRIYDNQQNADASVLNPALRFVFEGRRKMKVGSTVVLKVQCVRFLRKPSI